MSFIGVIFKLESLKPYLFAAKRMRAVAELKDDLTTFVKGRVSIVDSYSLAISSANPRIVYLFCLSGVFV